MAPPIVRALDFEPGFVKTVTTIIIPATTSAVDFNIPAVRFTNIDPTAPHFLTLWKSSAGTTDANKTLIGPNFTIPKGGSPLELGPLSMPPGFSLIATAEVDDKIVFHIDGWKSDFS